MSENGATRRRFPRTKKEREFRQKFWRQTGFELVDDTRERFIDVAKRQLNWYLIHAQETHRNLENDLMDMFPEE